MCKLDVRPAWAARLRSQALPSRLMRSTLTEVLQITMPRGPASRLARPAIFQQTHAMDQRRSWLVVLLAIEVWRPQKAAKLGRGCDGNIITASISIIRRVMCCAPLAALASTKRVAMPVSDRKNGRCGNGHRLAMIPPLPIVAMGCHALCVSLALPFRIGACRWVHIAPISASRNTCRPKDPAAAHFH